MSYPATAGMAGLPARVVPGPAVFRPLERVADHMAPQMLGMFIAPRGYCYPTDTTEEEWAFAAPYLTLLPEDAGQRRYPLRASYDALRWIVRAGAAWRLLPGDFPPWHAVYDQARRWLAAGCFEAMAHDLRVVLRLAEGRAAEPSAAILDSRTLRSTPESGARAGYDGAKRQKGSRDRPEPGGAMSRAGGYRPGA